MVKPITVTRNSTKKRVSIIGGGYSGAMVLVNLISLSNEPICIDCFEPNVIGEGTAYKTVNPAHLLNVRSDRMGAFAANPGHFYEWMQKIYGKIHAVSPDGYAPRYLYGEYIKSIVAESLIDAKKKGIEVILHKATVTNVKTDSANTHIIQLISDDGESIKETHADAVILATGNLPPRLHNFHNHILLESHASYVHDVWNIKDTEAFQRRVGEMSTKENIVLIGTGLTAIDTIIMLESFGYKGNIIAISRHGLIPAKHVSSHVYPEWEWTTNPADAPRSILGMLTRLKKEIKRANEKNYSWHSVIDSIRPVTQILWKQLSDNEKRKFLKHLSTFWGIHRHRMAPEIWDRILKLQQAGRLKYIAGRVCGIDTNDDELILSYRQRGSDNAENIRPAVIMNCTGPEYDVTISNNKLLKDLLQKEIITAGALRAGICLSESGAAAGNNRSNIFPMGALLVGELFECTAIPELRHQTLQTATLALKYLENQ